MRKSEPLKLNQIHFSWIKKIVSYQQFVVIMGITCTNTLPSGWTLVSMYVLKLSWWFTIVKSRVVSLVSRLKSPTFQGTSLSLNHVVPRVVNPWDKYTNTARKNLYHGSKLLPKSILKFRLFPLRQPRIEVKTLCTFLAVCIITLHTPSFLVPVEHNFQLWYPFISIVLSVWYLYYIHITGVRRGIN